MTKIFSGFYLTFIFPFLFFLSACASAPTDPAPWDISPAALEQHYPESRYIAQQGRGRTRAQAEANGAAAIARFLNTQISSRLVIAERSLEQNGNVQSSTEIESEIFVQSQMDLYGIRYAADPYYDNRQRVWVTVAYITRDEAWQVYSPRFRQQAETFRALFRAAENERDPFRKAQRYIAAQNFSRSADFQSADLLGQLLYPARMNAEFGPVRTELASLTQRIEEARRNAPVYIDCPVDFESIIAAAFSSRFAALGFPVSSNRNTAAAICRITIEEGRQQRDLGIFYFPKLQAVLSSPAGTLYTFNADGGQASAVTPDVARRRAYQALADKVNAEFALE